MLSVSEKLWNKYMTYLGRFFFPRAFRNRIYYSKKKKKERKKKKNSNLCQPAVCPQLLQVYGKTQGSNLHPRFASAVYKPTVQLQFAEERAYFPLKRLF